MLPGLLKIVKFIPMTESLAPDIFHTALHMSFLIAPAYIAKAPAKLKPTSQADAENKLSDGYPHVVINHLLIDPAYMGKKVIVRFHEG